MVVLIEPDGDVEERYDYENRLVKITDGVYNIAEYTYDALGRRIEMKTYDNGEVDSTTRYYYNNNWQVLAETDYDSTGPTETQLRDYIYGNYIDEVLIMTDDSDAKHYYGHDHIFSVVTLIEPDGDAEERYEYDAYGKPTISNAGFTQTYDTSQFGNPYMFTSRHVDSLDSDDLQLQYNRNRYYDYHTGRWLTHDPLGIQGSANLIDELAKYETPKFYLLYPLDQYIDSLNLYQYTRSKPISSTDVRGLWKTDVHKGGTAGWAYDVGYKATCANKIGKACDAVDDLFGGRSPRPLIGNLGYHFDQYYNPLKGKFMSTMGEVGSYAINENRAHYTNKHMTKARESAQSGDVDKALKELGTALHPLQDSFSHNKGHSAHTPFHHAPSAYCALWGDLFGIIRKDCRDARENNPNWNNWDLPDKKDKWYVDYEAAGEATRPMVAEILEYPLIQCKCKRQK